MACKELYQFFIVCLFDIFKMFGIAAFLVLNIIWLAKLWKIQILEGSKLMVRIWKNFQENHIFKSLQHARSRNLLLSWFTIQQFDDLTASINLEMKDAAILKIMKMSEKVYSRIIANYLKFLSSHSIQRQISCYWHQLFEEFTLVLDADLF